MPRAASIWFRQAIGACGRVRDAHHIGDFTNTLPNELIFVFDWGVIGAPIGLPAAHYAISIPAGGVF